MGDAQAAHRHRRRLTREGRLTGIEVVLAVAVGTAVGMVVGLLGAGGSILTVPALMLLLGLTATQATGTSLVVVGVVAAVGLVVHARVGRVDWRAGLIFALVGMPAAALGGRASILIPDVVLTLVLVGLLASTAVWMWLREAPEVGTGSAGWSRLVPAGLGIGAATGLLGVGGGFAVVPALSGMLGLPMPVAIATSQLVLVFNAAAGLAGRIGSGVVAVGIGLVFAAGGALGSVVAGRMVGRLADRSLTRLFAGLLAVVAIALLVDVVI